MSLAEDLSYVRNGKVKPDNYVSIDIGKRMRALRMSAGHTQTWLGERIGCTYQQVQKFECGYNNIPIPRLLSICKALGVDWAYFLDPLREDQKAFNNTINSLSAAEMLVAFNKVKNSKARRALLSMAHALSDE